MKATEYYLTSISQTRKKSETPFFDHHSEQEQPFFAASHQTNTSTETPFFTPSQAPRIQAKLNIGQKNDVYEQEADSVANEVVQRLHSSAAGDDNVTPHANNPINIQRKCADCEAEEETVQKKESNTEGVASSDIEAQLNSSKGGGSPLPDDTRTSMESAMGADFSNVRIHTGSNAIQMSQDLNAQAFTHGNDVYFNSGKYNPSSTEGGRLLAHELTHTIQQNSSPINSIQRLGDVSRRPLVIPCPLPPQQFSETEFILFPNRGTELNDLEEQKLENFVRNWRASAGQSPIKITGHASTSGTEELNWQLSCSRAVATKQKLIEKGIPETLIEIFAKGKTDEFGSVEQNRRASIFSAMLSPPAPPRTCGDLKIWLNVFIPQNVAGYTYPVIGGPHAGKTAIPCPASGGLGTPNILNPSCAFVGYLTDQRSFDSTKPTSAATPSVRMRSFVNIDFAALSINQRHESSGTTEVVRRFFIGPHGVHFIGDVTCQETAAMSNCHFTNHLSDSDINSSAIFNLGTINYDGAASDPCVNMAADIDYNGSISIFVNPRTNALTVLVSGLIDSFPAYEMYAEMNGEIRQIFRQPPPAGNTVMNLLGNASTPASGSANFSCQFPTANMSENE